MPAKLAVPKFIDHYPQHKAEGFLVTNEEPSLFNQLLGDTKINKAACIASGGEILLSTLLPRAKEIIAVDHSYNALAACAYKLLLLQKMPAKQLRELLITEQYQAILDASEELWKEIPTANEAIRYRLSEAGHYQLVLFRKAWHNLEVPRITAKTIGKVTLLHADLLDLKTLYGTFDLLYVSNAMEHSNRKGKYTQLSELAELVAPGGLFLFTRSRNTGEYYGYRKVDEQKLFDRIGMINGFTSSWEHIVLRKKG